MHLRAFSLLENQERLIDLARNHRNRMPQIRNLDLFAATLKSANLSSRSRTLDAGRCSCEVAIVRFRQLHDVPEALAQTI
jgi:hypothetical protein